MVPLAYDALGAPSQDSKDFLGLVGGLVPESRRKQFYSMATLLLSVALAKQTAHLLLERTEATLLGENCYGDFDVYDWAEYCFDDWEAVRDRSGAADPVAPDEK